MRVFLYLFRPRRDHLARQYLLTQERRLLDSPRSPTLRVWDLLSRQAGSWSRRAMKVTSAFGQYSLLPMSSASFFFDFDLDSSRLLRFYCVRVCVCVYVPGVCRRTRRNGVLLSQTPFFFFSFLLCDVHMQRTSLQFFLSCLVCWFSFRIIFSFCGCSVRLPVGSVRDLSARPVEFVHIGVTSTFPKEPNLSQVSFFFHIIPCCVSQ